MISSVVKSVFGVGAVMGFPCYFWGIKSYLKDDFNHYTCKISMKFCY
ncbi:hypothetical protein [Moraxella lacunata]